MSNNKTLSGTVLFGCAAVLLPEAAAWAQPQTDSVEEITVTATRKSESIQDVPISVTAFDQSAIQTAAISGVDDLARLTPGLSSRRGNTGQSMISIRGIASSVGASTTGIYIDDTPIQVRFLGAGLASGSAYPVLFDLDRVEVLRGPQGTLFGSGSEGGNIRFITPEASSTQWSGHARAELAFADNGMPAGQLGVAVGGPLIDDVLGVRISAYGQRDPGWVDLQPYPGSAVTDKSSNANGTQAFSGSLSWKPVEGLMITPSVFYQSVRQDSGGNFWTSLSNPGEQQLASGAQQTEPTLDRFVLTALRVKWDFQAATLYSNTSYMDRRRDAIDDYSSYVTEVLTGNYTGPATLSTAYFKNPQKQLTQELRLQSSDTGSRLHWVTGAFYQKLDQKADENEVVPGLGDVTAALYGLTVQQAFGEALLPGGVGYLGHDVSSDSQIAGFAQVDYAILDALTITAGIRYTHSKYSYSNFQDGPANFGPSGAAGGTSENDSTPKVGLSYKPTHNLLFYASAAKGFRPGGANTPVAAQPCAADLRSLGITTAPLTYNSDNVWSYEIGSKGETAGHRLSWDASAFHVKWNNIQNQVYLPGCGFNFIANLGAAVSRGADLQLNAKITKGLSIVASVGYTDATYSRTVGEKAADGTIPAPIVSKGDKLGIAPWHGVIGVDYRFAALGGGAAPYLHIDDEYSNGYRGGNPSNALDDPITAYSHSQSFATARAGVRVRGWDLSLFSKNLFNSHSTLSTGHGVSTTSLVTQSIFPPRTIGVTATYDF